MKRGMERKDRGRGGRDGRREAAVTPRRSLELCSGLLEIAQRRREGPERGRGVKIRERDVTDRWMTA